MFDGVWWGHLVLLTAAAGSVLVPGLVDAAARARQVLDRPDEPPHTCATAPIE